MQNRNGLNKIRVWDLPTRVFHWALVATITSLAVSGLVGGNAMVWHFRLGYLALSLLLFRVIWGVIGGRWSRFRSFIYSPKNLVSYLKGRGKPEHSVGHSPIGAASVFGMLFFLLAQVGSGLTSDDEIAFTGPLSRFVSNATVSLATNYHKDIGKWILLALVVMHIVAILFYIWRKHNLLPAMLHGDKDLVAAVPPSRDDAVSRVAALIVFGASCGVAVWIASLGS
ncbi:MAG: cytochrome B [Comamonadaceae bacterium]|nr:MAG: cytochrome B [Comamonadaceae bacterium]